MRRSLRAKLIAFGLVFAVLPLVVAMLPLIDRFQSAQRSSVLEREALVAESAAEDIEHFLELQFKGLQEIELFFPEILAQDENGDLYVERVLFKNDAFFDIAVVDAEGQEVMRKHRYRVIRNDSLRDRGDSEAFETILGGDHYLGEVYFEQGQPLFTIGTYVEDVHGAFQGAVFAKIDARTLQEVVRNASVNKQEGRTYIVNEDGVVIAHPNSSTALSQTDLSSVPLVSHLIENPASSYTQAYRNETENEVLGAWSVISAPFDESLTTGWYVISEENVKFALRHVREMIWFAFAALAFVTLLTIPAVIAVSNHILVPIEKVHKFVRRVGNGDFTEKVSVRVKDEIGEMAHGVNEMVDSLQKAREREAEISRMKSEFLSIAAHQLRTPLSAIKWTFQMILDGDLGKITKKQKKFLERGSDSSNRVISLVNDLLNVSRIEEGKFEYELVKLSPEEIVEEVVSSEQLRAKQKKLTLNFHKPSGDLPTIKADKEKLKLALSNLLDNALKYTPSGGSVDVYIEERDDAVLFRVSDTGVGIPKEQQESDLFTKFSRGENAVKLQTEGSGLGLFLIKNIVEAHGGNIWVNSEEGEGTTFYFTIPQANSN